MCVIADDTAVTYIAVMMSAANPPAGGRGR